MLFISIIILALVAALPSFFISQLPENCYNRISALVLLFCVILTFNSLNLESIGSGVAIFGGLYHVTIISQFMDVVLFTTASFILIAWPLIIFNKKVNKKVLSSEGILSPDYSSLQKEGLEKHLHKNKDDNLINSNLNFTISSSLSDSINLTLNNKKEIKNISYSTNYSIIILFSIFGASLLVSCYDLISMYLSIELQSFAVYVLATLYKNSDTSTSAGLKYFLLGGLSSCFILFGAGLIYTFTGLTNFESIYSLISVSEINSIVDSSPQIKGLGLSLNTYFGVGGGGFFLGIIFILVGFLFKISAAPLHNWSPAKHFGKMLWWVKLSNSGDTLKLIIPNYNWKIISGWINHSGTVTSYKMSENEMGYRGSKSVFLSNTVKEQRVDGSYFEYKSKLRCTLMGFERNYRIKIPSKQLNMLSFSTLIDNKNQFNNLSLLNPWFLTGLVDAEGCFLIDVRQDAKYKVKWRVSCSFQLKLHIKDIALLEQIKNTLGVGTITKDKVNTANFNVWSIKEMQVIIDHFEKYPLVTCKVSDYLLFKKCFEIIKDREHLTEKGLLKILGLKYYQNLGLSEKLKKSFPEIIPVNRPQQKIKGHLDPFWISGFTSGDGSFYLEVSEKKSKVNSKVHRKVVLVYSICLHSRDEEIIRGLVNYFKSLENPSVANLELKKDTVPEATNYILKTDNTIRLIFRKFSDIVNIIIPFFEKYPLEGKKSLDFEDFKKVAEFVKIKDHLTLEGYNKIKDINSTMNLRRPWS
jgi:hypothetical protein